ncbi:hypothetical protein DOTSEDRAFT_128531 [Dothistroma septosporum NZE10]|uniref:MYND-type domain-containing protein n=1 Tax=Dothistroma septosporum (strain NZE10 / CBS 128990) TaxID=675120 RepID=N1PQ07_DOTSN|nr:hypothetical protein DOTSEDRAFT_128531 [Dothistroma septosporum NZE10]
MGAWALKLFMCDYDLDLIGHLGVEVGLPALEQQQTGKTATDFRNPASARMLDHQSGRGARYSLYAKLCSHPEVVRKYLDDGALSRVTADLRRKINAAHEWWLKDCYGPGYHLCILGACTMTLGAVLSNQDKAAIRAVYKNCELMRDAVTQLDAALDLHTGYVNGVPWNFGVSSIGEIELASKEDLAFPAKGMINVRGPDHGRNLSYDPYTDEMMALRHPDGMWKDHACGECGSSQSGHGQALLKCSKCKKRCYCSKDCQKEHWKNHRGFCRAPRSIS